MEERFIRVIDSTLRDGSHAVGHQFTVEQAVSIARALQAAGLDTIEVGHGDGLGGSSIQYGRSAVPEERVLEAVAGVLTTTKLGVLLLPGIGTKRELRMAIGCGAKVARIATHVTEADIGEQHIRMAREMGLEAIGFLMTTHMAPPETVAQQAKLFESYGAQGVYVADSAGAMTPRDVVARVEAVRRAVGVPVGFHAHNNLGLAIGNTLAAVSAGARMVDGTLYGLGAGAGNAQTEVIAAVLDKEGYRTGIDLYAALDASALCVRPLADETAAVNTTQLMLGYAGVYSSFLLHTYRASERFGVDPRDVLVELGRRKVVGGQEDMIVQVAAELAGRGRPPSP